MPSLGSATLTLDADDKQLDKDLDRAEKRVSKFGKAAKAGLLALGGGALAAGAGIAAMVKKNTELADELFAVSSRTGIAVGELHGLRNIAEHLGSEDGLEGIVDSAQELGLRLQEVTKDGFRADAQLVKLGLSGDELREKTPTEALLATVRALQGVEDQQKRNLLADELFGGSWEHISGILATSQDEFDKLVEKEQGVMAATEAVVGETFRMQTAWRDITRVFADAGGGLQADLMGRLADFLELVRDHAPAIKAMMDNARQLISGALLPLGAWFGRVGLPQLKLFSGEVLPAVGDGLAAVGDAAQIVWDFFTAGKIEAIDPLIGSVEVSTALWEDLYGILATAVKPALDDLWEAVQALLEPFEGLNTEGGESIDWAVTLTDVLTGVAHVLGGVLAFAIGSVASLVRGLKIGLELLTGAFNVVRALIAGDWTLAWLEMQRTVGRVWNSILDFISQGVNNAIRLFNGLIAAANIIPGVDINTIGEVSLGGRISTSGIDAEIAAHRAAGPVNIQNLNVRGVLDAEGAFDTVGDVTRELRQRGAPAAI